MLYRVTDILFKHRVLVVGLIAALSAILGLIALNLRIVTDFRDLLPSRHAYVQVHESFKETFGGTNVITIMVEPEEGDVFQPKVLNKIKEITEGLYKIDAVNDFQIVSLASKKLQTIHASTEGIASAPVMWPDVPQTQAEADVLRQDVVANPMVYGSYISRDLKAGLITVDFIDRQLNDKVAYQQIQALISREQSPGIRISHIGEPILSGEVQRYLPETLRISLVILVAMAVILFVATQNWRSTLLPMTTAFISAAISLGVVHLAGLAFDPLMVVIVFLISARAISHSVQFCTAFDDEREIAGTSSLKAARQTFVKLIRPSSLGLVVDIGSILVVMITPIPLLQKTALIGAVWLSSLFISACILVPVALSWTRRPPQDPALKLDATGFLVKLCNMFARLATRRGSALAILAIAGIIGVLVGEQASEVTVGDANPGSPILWSDSKYNQDWAGINQRFGGADRMFIVVKGDEPDALKRPEILKNMQRFQRFIGAQPEIAATVSFADILGPVNMMLHEGNPRFDGIADDATANSELAYMYQQGAEPGDLERFVDTNFQNGSVILFFRDHKGDTIRTAVNRIKEYIHDNPMAGAHYALAGGLVGVLSAVNEVIFADQIKSIALALIVLFVVCSITYRSAQAGLFFLPLILLSNAVTFAFMKWNGIGMNINTLPVAAVGIGLGVDYAFYIVDRVQEKFRESGDIEHSIRFSLATAGRGVVITGITMITSVIIWYWLSSLRFQAEMGLLIALWMAVSALCSLLLIPSMIFIFRPSFVLGDVKTKYTPALSGFLRKSPA